MADFKAPKSASSIRFALEKMSKLRVMEPEIGARTRWGGYRFLPFRRLSGKKRKRGKKERKAKFSARACRSVADPAGPGDRDWGPPVGACGMAFG